MKKVLSFCVLSVLLAVLSLGLKAQSGLVLTPANLPSPMPLNQYDTIYLSPGACFDALGLSGDSRISIEWQVLRDGSVIPDDSLSYYFETFKFESLYEGKWWGNSYTSNYCKKGNGHDSYPGARTPAVTTHGHYDCEDRGPFGIVLGPDTYFYDFFFANWFSDTVNTAHRLVYNIKEDGDYQFIFSIATRTGGTKWDDFYVDKAERYYVGGHGSVLNEIVASDTLHSVQTSEITDYYRCLGDSLTLGNPPVVFTQNTDTAHVLYDSVFYMGASSCNAAIDSIVRFRVFFEDPSAPVLDTLNSTLAFCDSGMVSIRVNLTAADKCIWLDGSKAVVDTLNATAPFETRIYSDTTFYVLGYNSASGCVSSDTLAIYPEVFTSPTPNVTVSDTAICENGALTVLLNKRYDEWTWFHNGVDMNLNDTVYNVTDVAVSDSGWYKASVVEKHGHSRYIASIDTVSCSASDSAHVTVYTRPSVEWASLDGITPVTDSTLFCPNDLDHYIVAAVSGGTPSYKDVVWTGITGGTETYNADKSSDTLYFTLANTCGGDYTVIFKDIVDTNGCHLKDTIKLSFFVNDTVKPIVTKMGDTVSTRFYDNCEYVIPDLRSFITITDNCDSIRDTIQVPAAGTHVTVDTFVVITVHDLCGNEASDTIKVDLPVHTSPTAEWASFDGVTPVTDSMLFCPNDLDHYIVATVTGGTPSYKDVVWTGITGGTETYNTDKSSDTLRFTLPNTCGGVYTVVFKDIVDTNGCHLEDTIKLTFFVNDTVKPTVTKMGDTVSIPAYRYAATSATPNCEYIIPDLRSFITASDGTFCGEMKDTIQIPAEGTHVTTDTVVRVIVRDLCDNADTAIISVKLPVKPLAIDTIEVTATVLCAGDANGAIRITVKDGNPPYDVQIQSAENASLTYTKYGTADQTIFDFDGLVKGKWNITVTDTNGCQEVVNDTANVASPNVLTLVVSDTVNLTCNGSADGSFKYRVSQGTAPYTMTIIRTFNSVPDTLPQVVLRPSNLDTLVEVTGMKAGSYVVSVEDSNLCKDSKTFTLTQPDSLKLEGTTVLNHVKCFGDSLGNLAVTGVTGGTYPYYYAWVNTANDTVNTDSVTGRKLPVGYYTIHITDANNCLPDTVLTDTIKGPDAKLEVVSVSVPEDTCPRLHTYTFTAEVAGGRPNYEFQWTLNTDEKTPKTNMSIVKDTFDYVETVVTCDTLLNIEFKVTDDSNCVATKDTSFRIADKEAPTLTGTLAEKYIDGCAATDANAANGVDTLNTIAKLQAEGLTIDDNCTAPTALIVNFSETVTGTCPIKVERTYTVTDSCGLPSAEVKHVIYVQDTTRPTYTRPVDDTLYLSATCTVDTTTAALGVPTNLDDNCTNSAELQVSHRDEVTPGCGSSYEFKRYWRVTDACGNVSLSDSVQTITVMDTTKPVFTTHPMNKQVACDDSPANELDNYLTSKAGAVASDNCTTFTTNDIVMVQDSVVQGCNVATKTYYFSFTITDECGNTVTEYATFKTIDTVAPEFTSHPSNKFEECSGTDLESLRLQSRSESAYRDDCAPVVFVFDTLSNFSQVCASTGTYTYYITVTDSCQTATDSCVITIYDNTPPVPVFSGQDRTPRVECDGKGNLDTLYNWIFGLTAEDACSGVDSILIYYMSQTTHQFEIFDTNALAKNLDGHIIDAWDSVAPCMGSYHFQWIIKDSCGNEQPLIEDFEIEDKLGPVFTNIPSDTTVQCGYDRALFLEWLSRPQAYDSCSRKFCDVYIASPVDSIFRSGCGNPDGLVGGTGQYEIYWTSKDVCGTISRTERRIWKVQDTIAPQVTTSDPNNLLLDDTLYYPSTYPWTKPAITSWSTRMDNVAASNDFINAITTGGVINDRNGNPHIINAGIQSIDECGYIKYFKYIPTSTIESDCADSVFVDFIFEDACENSDTLTQLVVILDTTPPIVVDIVDTLYQKGWYDGCVKGTADTLKTIRQLLTRYYPLDPNGEQMERTIASIIDDESHLTLLVDTVSSVAGNTCDSVEVRTYRISDACGNDTTFLHTIVYLDTITPIVTREVIYDTIHQKSSDCNTYYEAYANDESTIISRFTDTVILKQYDLYIYSCHDFTIELAESDTVKTEEVCPGKIIVRKFSVKKECASREYVAYYTVKLIVKDTVAPEILVTNGKLTSDTVYTDAACEYVVPNVHFNDYAQLVTWEGTDVAQDCNLGQTSNVTMYDSLIVGEGCEFEIHYKYTVEDSCGNMSDTLHLTIYVMDTLAPQIQHDTATLVDTVYFTAHNCVFPDLQAINAYWTTPQQAIDHGVQMTDCNPKWSDAANLNRYDEALNDTADLSCATFITVKYAVKDSCGTNWSDTIYQRILVLDTIRPTRKMATLRGDTIYSDDNCAYTLPTGVLFANYGQMTTWQGDDVYEDCNLDDACEVWISEPVKDVDGCDTLFTYKYTIADKCGNWSIDTVELTVRVIDTLAPLVTHDTATLYDTLYYQIVANNCEMPDFTSTYWTKPQDALDHGVEFTDCNPDWDNTSKIVRFYETQERDVCSTIVTVRYQVTDKCSGFFSDTICQLIIVLDTAAPVVSDTVKDTTTYMVDDASDCWGPAVDYFTTVGQVKAYDPNFTVVDCNVGDDSRVELVVSETDSSSIMCTRTVVRTYVVYDSCDHPSNHFTHKIFVSDTARPNITGTIADTTVYITSSTCGFEYPRYTNVNQLPGSITIEDCNRMDTLYSTVDTLETSYLDCHHAYTLNITYTVKDSCEHASTFSAVVYVSDTTAPKISGLLDTVMLYKAADCSYLIPDSLTFTAWDSVKKYYPSMDVEECQLKQTLTVSSIDTVDTYGFCPMLIHRYYVVYDSCDLKDTLHQYFYVKDTVRPEVTVHNLTNDTVFIDANGEYLGLTNARFDNLNAITAWQGADVATDCNLAQEIVYYGQVSVIDTAVCDGSYLTRKYAVKDSCGNVSVDTIFQKIVLRDTIAPELDAAFDTIYNAERTAADCEFVVPNLRDTIIAHYQDNWSDLTEYYQVPAAGYAITNFRDTVVKITFADVCKNWSDTVTVTVKVPKKLVMDSISMTEPLCHGGYGTIFVSVTGGMPNYTFSYGVIARDSVSADTAIVFDSIVASATAYTVTVKDSNRCSVTGTITVTEPDEVFIKPTVIRPVTCFGDTTSIAIQMEGGFEEGGIVNYDVFAILLDADSTALDTVMSMRSITNLAGTDTIPIDPVEGIHFIYFYGQDSHGCAKDSISDTIRVWPVYETVQEDRICHTVASVSGYDWYDTTGVNLIDHIDASVFTGTDSTYVLTKTYSTVHGCDSVSIMNLRVENTPYLKIRRLSEASTNLSNVLEQTVYDTFQTSNTNVGWEIFVEKNCMTCDQTQHVKDPVSLEYDLYYLNETTGNYELMSNVTNYFVPAYRTFMDNWSLSFTDLNVADRNHVSVPSVYVASYLATTFTCDYYNLCWMSPDYYEAYLPAGHETTGSGTFYDDARANIIKIESFVKHGDYKIVATLHRRTGGFQPSGNYTVWGNSHALPYEIGGTNSTLGDPYYSTEIFFHVDGPDNNPSPMPSSAPSSGSVVYHSSREIEATANVYPNPARDYVMVELSGFEGQTEVKLSAYDGRVLKTITLDVADTHSTPVVRIEMGDYAQGVYMITVRNSDAIVSKRVVLTR